jgi:mycothiol synthase
MSEEQYGRPVRTLEVLRRLDPAVVAAIERLLADAEGADGRESLSDQHRLDLVAGGGEGFAAVVASDDGRPIGYAQVSHGNCSSTVETVVDPAHREEQAALGTELMTKALDVIRAEGGGSVHWWVFDPTADDDELARRLGFTIGRDLLQMRRDLPTDLPYTVTTRPFVPGVDEAAWVEVNNRAFAGHPEQGGWTVDTLRRRQAESWFDPSGFLLHERDGRLAGFCWTKLHLHADPPLGEIYVIGVDPEFQGLGLGRQLTLAGLDSIARRGVDIGMLYVDAANAPALAMYERLGFTVHRTDRAYTATL